MRNAEFNNARLVQVYDAECPWSRDDDFFMSIVNERPASRVLDFGCGTGRLALGMADAGHTVTGVDPAPASLEAARRKPRADSVTWIDGGSSALPEASFDAAVMTSHVAQFLVTDDEWTDVFGCLHRALVPGATLVFDTRDPAARAWHGWNPIDSRRRITLPTGEIVVAYTVVLEDGPLDVIAFRIHFEFPDGDVLTSEATLRFRTEVELRESLDAAGFAITDIFGGWNREPVGHSDGEFLVVAERR